MRLIVLWLISFPGLALVDCVSPAGVAGQILNQGSPARPYFCDGTNWFPSTFSVAKPDVCSRVGEFSFIGAELLYCDGVNRIGRTADSLQLGSCTQNGKIQFNPSTKVFSFCENGKLFSAKRVPAKSNYALTGVDQTYTAPPGVRRLFARIWAPGGGGGAGSIRGGGSLYTGAVGGGGGFAVVQFNVTEGETITLRVGAGGDGGRTEQNSVIIVLPADPFTGSGGAGGGYSGLFRSDTSPIAVIGGGGGGGAADDDGSSGPGGAGGVLDGASGQGAVSASPTGGGGGTNASGGLAGNGSMGLAPQSGSFLTGGRGGGETSGTRATGGWPGGGPGGYISDGLLSSGGGGGAGYYGGGGGGAEANEANVGTAGGGGGASGIGAGVDILYSQSGAGANPGGWSEVDKPVGVGMGGNGGMASAFGAPGGPGYIVIIPEPVP